MREHRLFAGICLSIPKPLFIRVFYIRVWFCLVAICSLIIAFVPNKLIEHQDLKYLIVYIIYYFKYERIPSRLFLLRYTSLSLLLNMGWVASKIVAIKYLDNKQDYKFRMTPVRILDRLPLFRRP
jgi:hypothetical protein